MTPEHAATPASFRCPPLRKERASSLSQFRISDCPAPDAPQTRPKRNTQDAEQARWGQPAIQTRHPPRSNRSQWTLYYRSQWSVSQRRLPYVLASAHNCSSLKNRQIAAQQGGLQLPRTPAGRARLHDFRPRRSAGHSLFKTPPTFSAALRPTTW